MKRPLIFALELLAAALVSYALGWTLNRFSRKENRQAQALERMASSLDAIAAAQTDMRYVAHPVPEKRRSLTPAEDAFLAKHPECTWTAYIGYDDKLHPDYCRP